MNFNQIKFGKPVTYLDGVLNYLIGVMVWGKKYTSKWGGSFSELWGIDPDATAFIARVVAAGGSLTITEQTAVNQLAADLKLTGNWNSMKAVYPMVGSSANSCAQNLISSSYTGTFSSGWTFTSTGAKPNGANTYFLTGFNPFLLLTPYNTSWSYYSRTNNINNGFELGCQNGFVVTDRVGMTAYYAGNFQSNLNDYPIGTILTPNTNSSGMYIISRIASTIHKAFRNGVQLGVTNSDTMTAPLPNAQYAIGTLSFNDGVNYVSTNRACAFSHIGTGLSDSQAVSFNTLVQNFQITLSRQV